MENRANRDMYRLVRTNLGRPRFDANADMGTSAFLERMVNMLQAESLVFVVTGRVAVPINLHVVGAESDAPRDSAVQFRIGKSLALRGSTLVIRRAIPVSLRDFWFPWIGVVGVLADGLVSTPETTQSDVGVLTITAYTRERV